MFPSVSFERRQSENISKLHFRQFWFRLHVIKVCIEEIFRMLDLLIFICLFLEQQSPPPPVGHGLLIHEVSRSHTTTHHSR